MYPSQICYTCSIMAENKFIWPIYYDFSHFRSIISPCGRDLKCFLCILFKFVLRATNKEFSDKFDNGWKKWPIYCDFSHFTSIIWPCGSDNMKSFPCILPKFVTHVTNYQFWDNFNNGWKKIQIGRFIVISLHFMSIIWSCGRITWKLCMYPFQMCYPCS